MGWENTGASPVSKVQAIDVDVGARLTRFMARRLVGLPVGALRYATTPVFLLASRNFTATRTITKGETSAGYSTLVEVLDNMITLDEIGKHYGTDKVDHGYLAFYDFLLAKYRDEPVNILEVGFQFGNSLRTWREYFKRSLICGIDVVDNGVQFGPQDGIALIIGDAYQPAMIDRLGLAQFDICIDDGSHELGNQLFFVQFYVPMLAPGGIAIVEDIASPKHLPQLRKAVPAGFQSVSVDLRRDGGLPDSILLLVWRE